MRRAPLAVLVGIVACAGPEQLPLEVAEVLCRRLATCDPDGLEASYGSAGECRALTETSMLWYAAEAQGLRCTYDLPAARACLERIRDVDCADLDVADALTGCGAAFGCP